VRARGGEGGCAGPKPEHARGGAPGAVGGRRKKVKEKKKRKREKEREKEKKKGKEKKKRKMGKRKRKELGKSPRKI
jgi:hypothetical protein